MRDSGPREVQSARNTWCMCHYITRAVEGVVERGKVALEFELGRDAQAFWREHYVLVGAKEEQILFCVVAVVVVAASRVCGRV